jgi:hypothetical protein
MILFYTNDGMFERAPKLSFFVNQADPKFLWNKHLLEELIENKVRGED